MGEFVVYRLADGVICKSLIAPGSQLDINTPEDCSAILGDNPDWKFRVDVTTTPHSLVEKVAIPFEASKASITADGLDVVTISGLPNPTKITPPEGEPIDVTDGVLDIAIDLEGLWAFVATSPLYLPTTIEILAE